MSAIHRRLVVGGLVISILTACGSGDDDDGPRTAAGKLNASVASYDLAADRPRRFLVGLFDSEGRPVSFGSVQLSFKHVGTAKGPAGPPKPPADVEADWIAVPGQAGIDLDQPGPRAVSTSQGIGVYEATGVRFDRAGFWQVDVAAELDGTSVARASASFEVRPRPAVPDVGDVAPRTENLLPGRRESPPKAVDSRADEDGTVPDPELHRSTLAASVANGKPTLLVVSTPVFCVSRFCGPVTDAVGQLAERYGNQANFVHIEVWRDYESKAVNAAAAEWILSDDGKNANEPWVFLIGRDGRILQRWDNVAPEAQLEAGIEESLG